MYFKTRENRLELVGNKGIYGAFPKLGVPFWGHNNEDYSFLGSTLGSPYFGKLPYA